MLCQLCGKGKKRYSGRECLTEDNLTTKRSGTGISQMKWNDVLGTMAVRDFN